MPMPYKALSLAGLVKTLLLSACCVTGVYADQYHPPFNYSPELATDSTTVEPGEPALGAAMPVITDPVQKVMHAVVTVEVVAKSGARTEATFGTDRKGSGVVIDSEGLIATAGYLVAEADTVKVTFANGITDEADIVAYDDSIGLGLLRPRNFRSTHALVLGDSSGVEKDQKALIVPAAGEEGAKSVTIGKVKAFTSGWEYMLDNAIHTYPPSTDFSGAALLSDKAELLGIGSLVSIDIDIDPKVRIPGNIFIPINALKSIMGELLTEGRSQGSLKPWLGLQTKDTKGGIKVGAVFEDAPAALSGIKAGDRIVAVNQKQVSTLKEMYTRLWSEHKPGDKIHLLVLRDDQYANVPVETVDRYQWLKLQDAQELQTQITQSEE